MIVESQIEKLERGKISSCLSETPDIETSVAKKEFHNESNKEQSFAKEIFSAIQQNVREEKTTYRIAEERPDYHDQIIKQQGEIAEGLKDDRNARKWYGFGIFLFVLVYICVVMFIFCWHIKMGISDSAIIALLISTNINIIGLLAAVVRYLFPRRDISLPSKIIITLQNASL